MNPFREMIMARCADATPVVQDPGQSRGRDTFENGEPGPSDWDERIEETAFISHITFFSYSQTLLGFDAFGQCLSCRDGNMRGWKWDVRASKMRELPYPMGNIPETVCLLLCTSRDIYFLALRKVKEPNVFVRQDMCGLSGYALAQPEASRLKEELEWWIENGEEQEFVLL
ncbi:hypothetical protein K458DRAFT_450127 [Lentithecium fluviatile CBS 122367]|uniref:Uncharacterized protein n=1 Tax=Lentithecium fluviatile CBS 122367 TaxID=1168545 RepID=A0A6G1J4Q4_9PLEO|nr:hypothetical protein K458DRAFT_450127 [Lentithecium fluviatile CBS 122367]